MKGQIFVILFSSMVIAWSIGWPPRRSELIGTLVMFGLMTCGALIGYGIPVWLSLSEDATYLTMCAGIALGSVLWIVVFRRSS